MRIVILSGRREYLYSYNERLTKFYPIGGTDYERNKPKNDD